MDIKSKAIEKINNLLKNETNISEATKNILIEAEFQNMRQLQDIQTINSALATSKKQEKYIQNLKKINQKFEKESHVKSKIFNIKAEEVKLIKLDEETLIPVIDKEEILTRKSSIINFIESLKLENNVKNILNMYSQFLITSNNKTFASTHVAGFNIDNTKDSIDRLYSYLDDLIKNLRDKSYAYESFLGNESLSSMFSLKVYYETQVKNIKYWGNITTETLDLKICKLFTAPEERDCYEQCSEFVWNEKFNYEQIINKDILILTAKNHIKDVQDIHSYFDLTIAQNSPIKKFNPDKKSKIFFMFKNHCGVLYDFKKVKVKKALTSFRPLQEAKNVFTVTFDIEAYFDVSEKDKQFNIPYICCFAYIVDNKIIEKFSTEGRDCVLYMLEHISIYCQENNIPSVELVAHNGGNYDFHYILSSVFNPSDITKILVRNNAFISFCLKFNNINFKIKDSYSFLLCSLNKAAKAFLYSTSDAKTDFPHHLINKEEDLQIKLQQWTNIDENIEVKVVDSKMFISSNHVINFVNTGKFKTLFDWSKEYCFNDVIVLSKVWIEFKRACEEIFNSNIVDTSLTLAGMSFNLFKAHLDPSIKLLHPDKTSYLNMRSALYGGRCVSDNGVYNDILCLDVKSLYPAAMSFYNQPHGDFTKVKKRDNSKLGIFFVTVIVNTTPPSNFFPLNINNEVSYKINEVTVFSAWYTSVDIDIGLKEGHKIQYTAFNANGDIGYEWSEKGKIFKDYITEVLYKYKIKFEEENNNVKRNVIKIIMNSLWGKFAQKLIETEYHIIHGLDFKETENAVFTEIWNTNYLLGKFNIEQETGSKPIQNGVFTLSWARYHMYKIWNASVKLYTPFIYSDTDSIFIKKEDFDINGCITIDDVETPVIGSGLGQLELEAICTELICIGKKQYIGFSDNKIEKSRFKGVPAKCIPPELYTFLLDKNNKAIISFLKFKRKWGVVITYMENKTVKQT